MDIEVKIALVILLVLLFIFIVLEIIFNVLIGVAMNSEKKSNKKIKYYEYDILNEKYEYLDMLNKEYEKLIIPSLKRLIVKLVKDTPLNREEREMLKDIIMESNKNE